MSRYFNGTTDWANALSTPVTAAPFTLMAWVRLEGSLSGWPGIVCPYTAGSSNNRFYLGGDAGGGLLIGARSTSSGEAITSTGAVPTGAWAHVAAVFTSTTSRAAYLLGGNVATNTTSINPSAPNRLAIGAIEDVPDSPFGGCIAHVAIWNVALNASEIAWLASGASPLNVRRVSLKAYWPTMGLGSTDVDVIANLVLTPVGTTGHPSEPPVRVVSSFDAFKWATVVDGAGTLTGQSATFSAGTLTESAASALTGQSATFSAGNLSDADSSVLSGQAATFSSGTLAAGVSQALTGQAATYTAGTLTQAAASALTGQQATFAAGDFTAGVGGDVDAALTGIEATFSAGTITVSTDAVVAAESGGGGGYWAFHNYASRRRAEHDRAETDRREAIEEAAEDARQAEIARLIHARIQREAEETDLSRLRDLVSKHSDLTDASKRVQTAFAKAKAEQTFSRLQALQRELIREQESEEMALLMILLADG